MTNPIAFSREEPTLGLRILKRADGSQVLQHAVLCVDYNAAGAAIAQRISFRDVPIILDVPIIEENPDD